MSSNLAPAAGLVLLEQAQQVGLGLHEFAGHFGAVIGLDQYRLVVGNLLDQLERFGRKRVQPARELASARSPSRSIITLRLKSARITPANRISECSPQPLARLAAGPVPPAQQNHVQVEHGRGQREEVEEARKRDHPGAEIVELGRNRPVLDLPPQAGRRWAYPSQSRKTGTAQKRRPG